MAHDHGGTFNNHQVARLVTFSQRQVVDAPGRVLHLAAEIGRIGSINFTYDQGGNPIGYTTSGPSTYIGKLIMVYEILGGDPLYDLQIRVTSQPVYIVASASNTVPTQTLSSGDVIGQAGLNDAYSAVLVQQMKGWTEDVIQWKRENIERKVRRAMDYVDQLTAEKALLLTATSASVPGSLADLTTQIATLLADPTYRATYNDTTNDFHGKFTHAPFSAYDPGPTRTIDPNYVRADGGVVLPGQQTSPFSDATPPTPALPGQPPTIPV